MKTQFLKLIIVSIIVFLSGSIGAQVLSFKSLNICTNDYANILSIEKDTLLINELPPGIYLARSFTQSLEKSDGKYYSHQILLENYKNSPEVCYKGMPTVPIKTQSFIPTVIDKTKKHKFGHTFWSLSTVLDKLTGAVYSKRSLIPNESYHQNLLAQGYSVASFQKTHSEFQIRLVRDIASWKETIVITYDQF